MEVTGLSIEDYNGMQKRIKDLEAIQKGESFSYNGTDYHILQEDEVTLQLLKLLEQKDQVQQVMVQGFRSDPLPWREFVSDYCSWQPRVEHEKKLKKEVGDAVAEQLLEIERVQKSLKNAIMDKRFLGWIIVFVQTVLLIGAIVLFITE